VVTAFSAVLGGRYVGALALATQAKVSDMLAARAQAVAVSSSATAVANAATVTTRKALLDKEAALSSLALAQAEYNVAKGSSAEAFALENLNATKSIAIQRSAAFAEAQLAQSAATRTATTAAAMATTTIGGLARNALALIGGPTGFAMIAGAALFYFYQKTQQAKQEAIDFSDKLDGVIAKMRTMSNVQLAAEIDKATKSINVQSGEVKNSEARLADLTFRLESAKAAVAGLGQGSLFYSDAVLKLNQLESEHIQLTAQVESEQTKLRQTVSKAGILRAQLNGTLVQGIDLLKRDGHEAGVSAGLFNQLGSALDIASKAKDKFNSSSIKVDRPQNIQDYLDKQEQQVELQSELNDRKRAQLKAEQDIRNLAGKDNTDGASKERLEQDVLLARERAGAEFDATKAIQEQKKATKEGAAEGKKAATQAESVAQKVENLRQKSELAASSTQEFSREQAILTAQQSLGKGATQAQVTLAGEYAAKAWDAAAAAKGVTEAIKAMPEKAENKSYAESMQNLKAALDAGKIDLQEYNTSTEKMALEHHNNLAKINAQAVVNPVASARAEVDPVQQLANENAQKLALMQQYQQQEQAILLQSYAAGKISYDQFIIAKQTTDAQYLALRTAQENQYQEQQTAAQWQLLSQQSLGYDMLTSAVDAFAGNASNAITGLITGSMSAEDALKSLGSTMLNSVVNSLVQVGVEMLKNFIIQQVMGGAATTAGVAQAGILASAWAAPAALASLASFGGNSVPAMAGMTATVGLAKGLAVAGARKNGGPVSAGSMYQVGEGGMPEIYQASNGSQYMIPGDNGKVISNKDMQGGGSGINVSVNITNTNGSLVDHQVNSDGNGGISMEIFIADMDNGGPMSQAVSRNHQAPRRATN